MTTSRPLCIRCYAENLYERPRGKRLRPCIDCEADFDLSRQLKRAAAERRSTTAAAAGERERAPSGPPSEAAPSEATMKTAKLTKGATGGRPITSYLVRTDGCVTKAAA